MQFFLPNQPDDVVADQLQHMIDRGVRGIRALTYEHGRSKYELAVGSARREFRRQTGPRGGYRKDADYERLARETGGMVLLIIDAGSMIEVYSEPGGGWALPSLVGVNEVVPGSTEYFDEFAAGGSA